MSGIKHIITYRISDGRIFGQHLSLAASSQSVISPDVGFLHLDVSAYTSGILLDERNYQVHPLSSEPFVSTLSTDFSVWNAPSFEAVNVIIRSELALSDHTQSNDAAEAGHSTASQDAWATYRAALRVFTSTMTGNYILDHWPVKPNDGSTAFDQYFDPIADIIFQTTAPHAPPRGFYGDAGMFAITGYKDHNERTVPEAAHFALYGVSADLRTERKSLLATIGFAGKDITFRRSVRGESGYYSFSGNEVPDRSEQRQIRGDTGVVNFTGWTSTLQRARKVTAVQGMFKVTGNTASIAARARATYGFNAQTLMFTYIGTASFGSYRPTGVDAAAPFSVNTPKLDATT